MVDVPRARQGRGRKQAAWIGSAVVGVTLVTAALSRLNPAAPTVERSTLWIDAVRMGEMVRAVRGSGTLVSEDVRKAAYRSLRRARRLPAQEARRAGGPPTSLASGKPEVTP